MNSLVPKILIRIGSLRNGGAEKTLVTLLKTIPENKYDIDLVLNLKFGEFLPEVPRWIKIHHINEGEMIMSNRPWEIPIKAYRKIKMGLHSNFPSLIYKNILKGKKYDVEIAANHVLAREMLRSPWKSSKKIVWIHNDLIKTKFPISDYPILFQYDKILSISDTITDFLKSLDIYIDEKVERFYNPIDVVSIKTLANEKLSISKDKKTIFSIGTLMNSKGFDRLIRCHAKLILEGHPHCLWIAGDGPDKQTLLDLTKKLGVSESVTFLGFQKNPYPYFRMADAYVLSSRYEGFPTVLFEAVVLKKDIISTEVSGANDILENGKLGVLVENTDDGLYQGMKKYLSHSNEWAEKRKNLDQYHSPFSLESSTRQFMDIIDKLWEKKN